MVPRHSEFHDLEEEPSVATLMAFEAGFDTKPGIPLESMTTTLPRPESVFVPDHDMDLQGNLDLTGTSLFPVTTTKEQKASVYNAGNQSADHGTSVHNVDESETSEDTNAEFQHELRNDFNQLEQRIMQAPQLISKQNDYNELVEDRISFLESALRKLLQKQTSPRPVIATRRYPTPTPTPIRITEKDGLQYPP